MAVDLSMKLVVLRSRGTAGDDSGPAEYQPSFDQLYSERVIRILTDPSACKVCGAKCVGCRASYPWANDTAPVAIIDIPAVLPHVIERPETWVPLEIPTHDVMLAIHVHEQVLLEVIKRCGDYGTKGIIVPVEHPDWVSGAAIATARKLCEKMGIEIAFPKPFCALCPPKGSVLDDFRERYHIGAPRVSISVADGRIAEARVEVSAACGATYYIARWLEGRSVSDDLAMDVVAKRMHSYPCTASMEREAELHGDTTMHVAGEAHLAMLDDVPGCSCQRDDNAGQRAPSVEPAATVVTPAGKTVHMWGATRDSARNIDTARCEILTILGSQSTATLDEIRTGSSVTPAAISSALLLLLREGEIERCPSGSGAGGMSYRASV